MTATVEEVIEGYKLWLLKTAWEYTNNATDAYDLAQEGSIAMWKAYESHDPSRVKLSTHLMNKARWRMAEVRQRGTFTGKPSQAGKRHSAGTQGNAGVERATDFGMSDHDMPNLGDHDQAILAYHHTEIMHALNRLKPGHREKIIDWFWNGKVDNKNRAWWDKNAKLKLRVMLAHLADLAE